MWVKFSKIFPELLDEEILESMENMLGKTVHMDPLSFTCLRCKFARVCVEMDLAAPLLPSLTVLELAQKVEYEGLHLICFKCEKYDHHIEDCSSLLPHP